MFRTLTIVMMVALILMNAYDIPPFDGDKPKTEDLKTSIQQSDYDAWDLSKDIVSCDVIDKASGAVILGSGGGSKGYDFFVTKRLKTTFRIRRIHY